MSAKLTLMAANEAAAPETCRECGEAIPAGVACWEVATGDVHHEYVCMGCHLVLRVES